MNRLFALNAADLYKPAHAQMYHPLTEVIFSNFTPRSDKYFAHKSGLTKGGVIVAGTQRMINFVLVEMWESFFDNTKEESVAKFTKMMELTLGKGVIPSTGVEELWELGYLPIEFRAQDEGVLSPIGVPVFTVHNTIPSFYWLTNYLETVFSAESWKTMTNATTAFQFRVLAEKYAEATCDNKDHVMFQFHDFSLRGLSCIEDGYKSGIGHLMSFFGTDNIPAVQCLEDNYSPDGVVGLSVAATEHSVATTNINKNIQEYLANLQNASHGVSLDQLRYAGEVKFLKEYIEKFVSKGIASYVLDSYDYWTMLTKGLNEVKDTLLKQNGKLVVRPDTGNPVEVVCGIEYEDIFGYTLDGIVENFFDSYVADQDYPPISKVLKFQDKYYHIEFDFTSYGDYATLDGYEILREIPEHEIKGSIEILWEIFGGEINAKGYKVLDSHIGLIYGDSINMTRAKEIFDKLEKKGFASSNVVMGVGSYTYQMVTRDTFGFAMKATGTLIDGQAITVSKEPKTDIGKKSAKGFLKVVKEGEDLVLVESNDLSVVNHPDNTLKVRFRDGLIYNRTNLKSVRDSLNQEVVKALKDIAK